MARFLPPEFPQREFRRGEQDTWDALDKHLPGDAVVFYSMRVPTRHGEREIDFLVAWPGVGLAVLEVKGGHIERDKEGQFWSSRGQERKSLELTPMEQASEVRYLLKDWLLAQGSPAARSRMQHLVVLPHTNVRAYDANDFRREQVVDEKHMAQIDTIIRAAIENGDGHSPLDADQLEPLCALLVPEMRTDADSASAAEAEEHSDRLGRELADRVAEWQCFPRLKVIGGAGTGKTMLAMAQAKRLAEQGQRVALVCYSRGLAAFLRREASTWKKPPAYVGPFHNLGTVWGAEVPDPDSPSDFWEDELPRSLGELAAATAQDDRFDAVVVDEGQDFGQHWWTSLESCLRAPGDGGLFVFLDSDQRVFTRHGEVPIDTPPICLSRNLRNTARIAGTFSSLVTGEKSAQGLKGPRVRFVQCAPEDAVSRADDAVEALLDDWDPGQVALLTTRHRHPEQVSVVQSRGHDAYWDDYFEGSSVCYGTVSGFKGLERSCVVLAINGFSSEAQAKEMLYVGLSRARSQLVVVGDLDAIASVGGQGVRKRLADAEPWYPPLA